LPLGGNECLDLVTVSRTPSLRAAGWREGNGIASSKLARGLYLDRQYPCPQTCDNPPQKIPPSGSGAREMWLLCGISHLFRSLVEHRRAKRLRRGAFPPPGVSRSWRTRRQMTKHRFRAHPGMLRAVPEIALAVGRRYVLVASWRRCAIRAVFPARHSSTSGRRGGRLMPAVNGEVSRPTDGAIVSPPAHLSARGNLVNATWPALLRSALGCGR